MSLMIFLTVVQAVVAALLVMVVLMQKSEGGGLGTGGSPAGLMSARGAADFMTKLTGTLATIFVIMSIVLAALAVKSSGNRQINDTLGGVPAAQQLPVAPAAPLVAPTASGAPVGDSGLTPIAVMPSSATAPAPAKKP